VHGVEKYMTLFKSQKCGTTNDIQNRGRELIFLEPGIKIIVQKDLYSRYR